MNINTFDYTYVVSFFTTINFMYKILPELN